MNRALLLFAVLLFGFACKTGERGAVLDPLPEPSGLGSLSILARGME